MSVREEGEKEEIISCVRAGIAYLLCCVLVCCVVLCEKDKRGGEGVYNLSACRSCFFSGCIVRRVACAMLLVL